MTNRSTVLAVALTLAVVFAAPVAAGSLMANGSVGESGTAKTDTSLTALQQNNSSENNSISPGAKLAGVVSVQGAEVSGEVEHRAFGQRIAAANSNAAKAAIIAEQSQDYEARLDEIRTKQQALRAKYENGTISTGQYKAQMAKLAAEARTIQRLLDTSTEVATKIPAETLAKKGLSVDSIAELQANAKNLTGPEVAQIAIEIGGKRSGTNPLGFGNGSSGGLGPVDDNTSIGGPGPVNAGNGGDSNPGNGSGVGSGNGVPGNGDNVTSDTPGPGNGTPGNGTSGNDTPGNGTDLNISVDGTTVNTTLSTTDSTVETLA